MLQASTPSIRIGEQFDDARENTKLSGGAEPNLPKRLLYNIGLLNIGCSQGLDGLVVKSPTDETNDRWFRTLYNLLNTPLSTYV